MSGQNVKEGLMSDRLFAWFRVGAVTIFLVVLGYTVLEWWYGEKSGLHAVRAAVASVASSYLPGDTADISWAPVVPEPEHVALQAQVDRLERTLAEYRQVTEGQIQGYERLIANLQRQIQALTSQRTPVEQVAALRAASRPVRWASHTQPAAVPSAPSRSDLATLARAAGFTFVQVRP
jgi:hypothetical protein